MKMTGVTQAIANPRAETTVNMETSTCKHEDRHSDHFLSPVFGDVFHHQTHFASSTVAFVLLGAQDARLAMQVLAMQDFEIKQSLSKVALVRQSVVGWVGAALSELGKDAGSVRRAWRREGWEGCCSPRTQTLRPV